MVTYDVAEKLCNNLGKVIKGKTNIIQLFVTAFLAGGHILIEDVPGTGKTTLVKALARSIGTDKDAVKFKRIQCTPDLLPYDITGVEIFNQSIGEFKFVEGPVFCNILLADELNRTPPKVQSALLEVMAEHQVTVGNKTYGLDELFFVAATQNPIESIGVYPLPSAQLDRFMLMLSVGYPDMSEEMDILMQDPSENVLPFIEPAISIRDVLECRREVKSVFVHPALQNAVLQICNMTRNHPAVKLGVSPRAGLQFITVLKMFALINNRLWVEDDDIKIIAPYVLSHRLIFIEYNSQPVSFVNTIVDNVLNKMEKYEKWSELPDSVYNGEM